MKTWPFILFAVAATALLAWQKGGIHSLGAEVRADASAAQAPAVVPVTVYTMEGCPYCQAALAYLDDKGQPYTNRDVQRDPDAYQDYMTRTGGNPGVPVIDVGGRILQGWNPQQLEQALADAG